MALPSARPDTAWSTGASALGAAAVNGAARLPAAKRNPVFAKVLVHHRLTAVVSTQNQAGISGFILRFPGERQNTKIYNNRTSSEQANDRILHDFSHSFGFAQAQTRDEKACCATSTSVL